ACAVRLSLILLGLVVSLMVMERLARGRARFSEGASHRPLTPWRLKGVHAWLATLFCLVPLSLGFLVPGWRLLELARLAAASGMPTGFWASFRNTVLLSGGSALGITLFALLLAQAVRLQRGLAGRTAARAAVTGYGLPGVVIALAMTLGLIQLSKALGISLLAGTLTGLVLAYAVRFLAVSYQPLESGLQRVCGSLDDASRTLGVGPWRTMWRVNLPLLRGPLAAAGLLTFLDVLKELPITLLLRPAGFSTLATRAWDLREQNLLPDACIPAVVIALLGIVGALWLHHSVEKG
ncbi:MAG: iron ABC transporter permease, partial [Verrucomicrobiaceae bacterium]